MDLLSANKVRTVGSNDAGNGGISDRIANIE